SAESGDLAVGDTTTLRTPDPLEVTVVGIASFGEADSLGPTTWAALGLDQARDVLVPSPGQLTGIVVAAEDGIDEAELVERLQPVLPRDVEAISGSDLTDEQQAEIESDFLGFFEALLLVFAGIALVVASFSIYNTFSI